jgi:uncharacterized protein (UPF0297 family)
MEVFLTQQHFLSSFFADLEAKQYSEVNKVAGFMPRGAVYYVLSFNSVDM